MASVTSAALAEEAREAGSSAGAGAHVRLEADAGSAILFDYRTFHAGGANRSNASRIGLNLTYCLGWLRQEENQYLSCPPEIAKDFDPALQDLLGYTQGEYALGYYSDPADINSGREIVPPEFALGRSAAGMKFPGS